MYSANIAKIVISDEIQPFALGSFLEAPPPPQHAPPDPLPQAVLTNALTPESYCASIGWPWQSRSSLELHQEILYHLAFQSIMRGLKYHCGMK